MQSYAIIDTLSTILANISSMGLPVQAVWFRGQADVSWTLKPTMLRQQVSRGQEAFMYSSFILHGAGMPTAPADRNDVDEWWTTMQHHGLPTRLLDWSTSALVGLYFAAEPGHDSADGEVFIFGPRRMNLSETGSDFLCTPADSDVKSIRSAAMHLKDLPDKVCAVVPYGVRDRLVRQRGGFTLHGSSDDLRQRAPSDSLRSVVIHAAQKAQIRLQLQLLGVTSTTYFFDLDHLAKELREESGFR